MVSTLLDVGLNVVGAHLGSRSDPGLLHENSVVVSGGKYVGACVVGLPLTLDGGVAVGPLVFGTRVLGGRVAGGGVSTLSFFVTASVGLVRTGLAVVGFGHLGSALPGKQSGAHLGSTDPGTQAKDVSVLRVVGLTVAGAHLGSFSDPG